MIKLSEYVSQVINDPKYGDDIDWVKGNLHRAHIEQVEAAHEAEVRAEQREIDAQIAESQGIIGSHLEPYWEGRDDASGAIAEEIRNSRLTIDECTAVAEEPEGEQVFIERYGMYHAKFGGIGGDVASLELTREAWKAMGEPDVLAVSFEPVREDD